ncbi:MAG: hypothetical protein ACJARP_001699 [Vicingaceae bacterium]|jgi:hypothetical protein
MTAILRFSVFLLILLFTHASIAQEGWEDVEDQQDQLYFSVLELKDGIYRTFDEFKTNSPSITTDFELRRKHLYLRDTDTTWLEVNEEKIWGCYKDGKIYVAQDGGIWKCVSIGRLLQFGTVQIRQIVNTNQMYGVSTQEVEIVKQYFIDTETGEIQELNSRNLAPYVDQEIELKNYKAKNKANKLAQTILLLKAYNELNPLKIIQNE